VLNPDSDKIKSQPSQKIIQQHPENPDIAPQRYQTITAIFRNT
jgi:hypothetical protein